MAKPIFWFFLAVGQFIFVFLLTDPVEVSGARIGVILCLGFAALLLKLNQVADRLAGTIAVQQIQFPLMKAYSRNQEKKVS